MHRGDPALRWREYVAEDMNGRTDMILDGGAVGIGLESTIVDVGAGTHHSASRLCDAGNAGEGAGKGGIGSDDSGRDHRTASQGPGYEIQALCTQGVSFPLWKAVKRLLWSTLTVFVPCGGGRKENRVIATDETFARYTADSVKSVGSREDEEAIAHSL